VPIKTLKDEESFQPSYNKEIGSVVVLVVLAANEREDP
jgi:hypothetical protein